MDPNEEPVTPQLPPDETESPDPKDNPDITAKFSNEDMQNANDSPGKFALEEALPKPQEEEKQPDDVVRQRSSFMRDKILADNKQIIDMVSFHFAALSQSADYEQRKSKILLGIIQALKVLKTQELDEEAEKTVRKELKKIILEDENIFSRLKKLILLRERDRSTRENSIKILKKLINFSKKTCGILLSMKMDVFICFILEREYKHPQVVKERQQCFKLIMAWLQRQPSTFPYILGQTIASIARNPEDQQLRKKGIEAIMTLCQVKPELGANVGGVKIMIDTLLDVNLSQQGLVRQDLIVHSILMMINNPESRIYLRMFKDLNRIFSIFTQADGIDKEPKKDILDKLQLQLSIVSKAIVNMIRTNNGLIYITSSPLGLASLIGALNQPIKPYKQLAILNLFIEIFDVPLYIGGNIYLSSSSTSPGQSQNLLNNYVALLLQAFYHCGVYEALIRVGINTDEESELNTKSRFLLKKIMYFSSSLLPEVPQIASLVNIATDFNSLSDQNYMRSPANSEEIIKRIRAAKIIKELSEISLKNPLELSKDHELFQLSSHYNSLNSSAQVYTPGTPALRSSSNLREDSSASLSLDNFPEFFMKSLEYFNQMAYGQSLQNQQIISNFQLDLQQYYYQNDYYVGQAKLDQKIQLTRVLRIKDFRDWDFTILLELFENDGVLWNRDRLQQYMERTKFFKRLLNFYMPSKERFVNLEWKKDNLIYARVGYLLLKTLLSIDIGRKILIGRQVSLYITGTAIIEDSDNPFHKKKSFIQDVEQFIEKEFMRFERSQQVTKVQNRNLRQAQQQPGFGPQQTEADDDHLQQVHSNERFFSKFRINQTMFRELISWLGLFTQTKDLIKQITKPPRQNQDQLAVPKTRKKDESIFGYLKGLVDRYGYYDHLLQIILHSFDFGIMSDSSVRDLLKDWSKKCSTNLSKSIIEAYRQFYRQGNLDFYKWCLPNLCDFLFIGDEDIKRAALSVLEEAFYDEKSINFLVETQKIQNIIEIQSNQLRRDHEAGFSRSLETEGSTDTDIFISKFLRSEKGFQILKENGWLDHKIANWQMGGGVDYIMRLERNIYDGLNINQLNSVVQQHALSIWIPIFEHSNDFRSDISTLKKFPFQVIVRIENSQEQVVIEESLQTYIEIGVSHSALQQQQVQIMGSVVRQFSKLCKVPVESNYYISASLKLGSQYINPNCKETIEPFWIKTDIGEQAQLGNVQNKHGIHRFKIIKSGVHFQFGKYYDELGEKTNKGKGANKRMRSFLESVTFNVQILPQKYKVIETPVHLYGELVKTRKGMDFIKERNDIKKLREKLLEEATPSPEKRSILWTLGHIGAHENGMRLILETSLIKEIVEMAENSQVLSLRGTCIYIIGMMCRTSIGRREIQKHNWIFSKSQLASGMVSVCLPRDPRNLFKVDSGPFKGSITCQKQVVQNLTEIKKDLELAKEEQEVLDQIGNLINGVTWQQAYNDLQKQQEKNPKMFMNPRLFEHTVLLLSVYNRIQPKTRKFIFNLFDQLIFQNKLLKERFVRI